MTPLSVGTSSDGTESVGLSSIPEEAAENVVSFRKTKDGKALVGWVLNEFEKARSARSSFEGIWKSHLAFYRNDHYSSTSNPTPLKNPSTPDQAKRKMRVSVNRVRSFVRTEHSKFVSQEPTVSVVPASSEDSDFRAATAGEQVWRSASNAGYLDTHYSEASWWKVLTGNGFLKTYWDGSSVDPISGERGIIRYGSVSPFHLFVPDLHEISLEEQPYLFNAYSKTLSWARHRFSKELKDCTPGDLSLTQSLKNNVTPDVKEYPDSVTVLEVWVKPGAHKGLPEGGLLHLVGSTLVGITKKMPYHHGLYPYTHLQHLHTGGFYRESPLIDLIPLQQEYNQVRSDLARAARQMGRPQLAVQKGSYTIAKHTNETGLIVEYNPGMAPPQPLPLTEIPAYVQNQQDRILQDFEDVSGQHEVSRGQAPGSGVTAGTAIAYLQESDDQFLTPQYRSDEKAFEKIAKQTLELFVQYVPTPRKIKSVGADRAFDMSELSGADIRNGTDVRVEKGSTISTSQVARRAEIKEMVGMGILTPEQALQMMEMGGAERMRETFDIARAKAQRENTKMKNLTVPEVMQTTDQAIMSARETLGPEGLQQLVGPDLVEMEASGQPVDEETINGLAEEKLREMAPALIPADDFDLHEAHIEAHDQFRMSQEFEQLPDEVKEQFEKHIRGHREMMAQAQRAAFLNMIPSDGSDGSDMEGGPSADPLSAGNAQPQMPQEPQPLEFGQSPAERAATGAEGPMNAVRAPIVEGQQ